jgi:hypothetical protein
MLQKRFSVAPAEKRVHYRQTDIRVNRWIDEQTDKVLYRQTLTYRQTNRRTNKKTGRQTGQIINRQIQIDKVTYGQTGEQMADKQTDR